MTKQGDGPTTRRMGFGYQQARAAGAPFRNERAASTLNAECIYQDVEHRTFNFKLIPIPHHPDPRAMARQLAKRGLSAERIVKQLQQEAEEAKEAKKEADRVEQQQDLERIIRENS